MTHCSTFKKDSHSWSTSASKRKENILHLLVIGRVYMVMVTAVGNQPGDLGSNPGWSCLHFT